VRLPLATSLKTRTGAPEGKDARLKNCYVETRGDQSIVRKRAIAQGGISIASVGTISQGGIGVNVNGVDEVFYFYGDTQYTATSATGTTWSSTTNYSVGDHVTVDFKDFWALTNNLNKNPTANPNDWSNSYIPSIPFSGTYATWNPADNSGAVLSNGNLTASLNALDMVRSTVGKSSGKWYWEYTITASALYAASTFQTFGVANLTAHLGNEVGNDANGWAYGNKNTDGTGTKRTAFTSTAYGEQLPINTPNSAVVGVALDMNAGTLIFYLNGVSQGTAFTGLTGTLYAAVGQQTQDGMTCTVIANFGASAFAYSVPSGYNSGLYTP